MARRLDSQTGKKEADLSGDVGCAGCAATCTNCPTVLFVGCHALYN